MKTTDILSFLDETTCTRWLPNPFCPTVVLGCSLTFFMNTDDPKRSCMESQCDGGQRSSCLSYFLITVLVWTRAAFSPSCLPVSFQIDWVCVCVRERQECTTQLVIKQVENRNALSPDRLLTDRIITV